MNHFKNLTIQMEHMNCTVEIGDTSFECNSFYGTVLWIFFMAIVLIIIIVISCQKGDGYFGAIDENKNLDIGLYIRNHREFVRGLKGSKQIPQDFPSWPENVVLPYRPWDNENQVPIY